MYDASGHYDKDEFDDDNETGSEDIFFEEIDLQVIDLQPREPSAVKVTALVLLDCIDRHKAIIDDHILHVADHSFTAELSQHLLFRLSALHGRLSDVGL